MTGCSNVRAQKTVLCGGAQDVVHSLAKATVNPDVQAQPKECSVQICIRAEGAPRYA